MSTMTNEQRSARIEDLERRKAFWDQFDRPEPQPALQAAFIVTRNLLYFAAVVFVAPMAVYFAFEPGVPARVLAWLVSGG